MASDRARQVARDVIKNLRNPKMTKGKILRQNGYAESVSKSPTIVTETKSYQEEMRPVLKRLEGLRDKVISELEKKDISNERFTELGKTLKDLNHDIQLLGGKPTEKTLFIQVEQEIAEKNGLSSSTEDNSEG